MNPELQISILATLAGEKRIISENGSLPWRISEEEKHFASLIKNQTIIIGRKAFEASVRDLSTAKNRIVLTEDISFFREGAMPAFSPADALQKARDFSAEEVFVVGGGEIFNVFLPKADNLYLTVLDREIPGDISFPECRDFKIVSEEEKQVGRSVLIFTELARIFSGR